MDTQNLVLDLSSLQKKRVVIKQGDELRDLYLNTSDMNIIVRFKEKYEELKNFSKQATEALSNSGAEPDENQKILKFADVLQKIDTDMRNALDYIFDSNVSEVCAPFGSMYDLIDGKMRYEHILDGLSSLYETSLHEETQKIENRISKHTDKYTN